MDAKFWNTAWEEGRTGFHQEKFHEKLLQYFPELSPKKGQRICVPLCGKTWDMIWLHEQGLLVNGIELHLPAIESFFKEHPDVSAEEIVITCSDFFLVEEKNHYDFVYDRAALVALPESKRKDYAAKISQILKPHGKYFLISFEHEGKSGPPFSATEANIRALYENSFLITVLESRKEQSVYVLEKKA